MTDDESEIAEIMALDRHLKAVPDAPKPRRENVVPVDFGNKRKILTLNQTVPACPGCGAPCDFAGPCYYCGRNPKND